MRSRLPGKLRSSPELSDAVIVKNRARLAKRRFVMRRTYYSDPATELIKPHANTRETPISKSRSSTIVMTSPLPDFP